MHQDRTDHYIGTANEPIHIVVIPPNTGTLDLRFGGATLPDPPVDVHFSQTPGEKRDLIATLFGPVGSHCVVTISDVDGGSDPNGILIQSGDSHSSLTLEFATFSAQANEFIAKSLKGKK